MFSFKNSVSLNTQVTTLHQWFKPVLQEQTWGVMFVLKNSELTLKRNIQVDWGQRWHAPSAGRHGTVSGWPSHHLHACPMITHVTHIKKAVSLYLSIHRNVGREDFTAHTCITLSLSNYCPSLLGLGCYEAATYSLPGSMERMNSFLTCKVQQLPDNIYWLFQGPSWGLQETRLSPQTI